MARKRGQLANLIKMDSEPSKNKDDKETGVIVDKTRVRVKELKSNFLNKYIYSGLVILILLLVVIFYFVSR